MCASGERNAARRAAPIDLMLCFGSEAAGRCRDARPYAPDAADAALLFFDFFDFEAVVSDAIAGADAAIAAGADAAASVLLFFDFDAFAPDAVFAGVADAAGGVCAVVVAGAAVVVFEVVAVGFAPVGGADEPLIVRPAASRFFTDFWPMPLTRLARSSASLNGPFFVRSSMIAFA